MEFGGGGEGVDAQFRHLRFPSFSGYGGSPDQSRAARAHSVTATSRPSLRSKIRGSLMPGEAAEQDAVKSRGAGVPGDGPEGVEFSGEGSNVEFCQ